MLSALFLVSWYYYNKLIMDKIRKSIDIPESEFRKIQLLSLQKGDSVKVFIENLITDALLEQENLQIVKTDLNK